MTNTSLSANPTELFGGDIPIVDFLAHDDTETFKTSGIFPANSAIGRAARAVNAAKEQELVTHFSEVRYDPIQDEYFETFGAFYSNSLEAIKAEELAKGNEVSDAEVSKILSKRLTVGLRETD